MLLFSSLSILYRLIHTVTQQTANIATCSSSSSEPLSLFSRLVLRYNQQEQLLGTTDSLLKRLSLSLRSRLSSQTSLSKFSVSPLSLPLSSHVFSLSLSPRFPNRIQHVCGYPTLRRNVRGKANENGKAKRKGEKDETRNRLPTNPTTLSLSPSLSLFGSHNPLTTSLPSSSLSLSPILFPFFSFGTVFILFFLSHSL